MDQELEQLDTDCDLASARVHVEKTNEPTPRQTKRAFRKNYGVGCCNCGQKPTVGTTQLCGPCCFGEAATAGGNW